MFGRPKDKRKYYFTGDAESLKKPQKNRVIALAASLAAFIVPPLVLDQQANLVLMESKQVAILAGYLVLVIFAALLGVYCFICAFTRAKLGAPVPVAAAPRAGWEKRTFLSVEWYMRLAVACTLAKIGLLIYAFSWQSLALVVFSAGAAVGAVFFRKTTFDAYKTEGVMELREPDEEGATSPDPENAEKAEEDEKPETAPEQKTNLPKLKRSDEETEDFYDRD